MPKKIIAWVNKTVNVLKQIKRINYLDVGGYVTGPMIEAQRNKEEFKLDILPIDKFIRDTKIGDIK